MSWLKKVFVIFTVAIVLATVTNVFLGGANATVQEPDDSLTQDKNTNVNTDTNTNINADTNTNANTNVDNNTTENAVKENTTTTDNNTNVENGVVADTNTNTNTNSNATNTATNTNAKNEFDWSQVRNTLPKTGSNYPLKNSLIAVMFVAAAVLGFVCMYNKKVGMTDETKR